MQLYSSFPLFSSHFSLCRPPMPSQVELFQAAHCVSPLDQKPPSFPAGLITCPSPHMEGGKSLIVLLSLFISLHEQLCTVRVAFEYRFNVWCGMKPLTNRELLTQKGQVGRQGPGPSLANDRHLLSQEPLCSMGRFVMTWKCYIRNIPEIGNSHWDSTTLPLTNLKTLCLSHKGNLSSNLRECGWRWRIMWTFLSCVDKHRLCNQTDLKFGVPAQPHTSAVTLGKLHNLSEPKFSCLQNEMNDRIYLFWGLNKSIHRKHLSHDHRVSNWWLSDTVVGSRGQFCMIRQKRESSQWIQ